MKPISKNFETAQYQGYLAWAYLTEAEDSLARLFVSLLGVDGAYQWLYRYRHEPIELAVKQVIGMVAQEELCLNIPSSKQISIWSDAIERWRNRLKRLDLAELQLTTEKLNARFITPDAKIWPKRFQEISNPPFGLWVKGNIDLLAEKYKRVAMVGARADTVSGHGVATRMAYELAKSGYVTVSGGAYGIDTSVHQATLRADGLTLSVMAGGLGCLYPKSNSALFDQITSKGAIISQYPPGIGPARWRFLHRNRLIAALSSGVVVIQAANRSGALNTAKHARELGIHLGAVPGDTLDHNWAGGNQLIRNGAVLIRHAQDVKELVGEINPDSLEPCERDVMQRNDTLEHRLWEELPLKGGLSTDTLAARAGISFAQACVALGKLENLGKVKRNDDLWVRLA